MRTITIETLKKKGVAFSIIAFPVILLAGFLMHPNLLQMEPERGGWRMLIV